jgi:hypothetical protein
MADLIDLHGGHVEIYFKSKDGVARSLRNVVFGEGGDGNSPAFTNFVQRARVKISILRFTDIEVTFAPPFEQAVKLLKSGVLGLGFGRSQSTGQSDSSDPELAGASKGEINFNTIVVRFHHGGKKSPYFKGLLLVPEVDIGVDGITITVKATGLLFDKTKTSSGKPSDSKSRLSIIQSLIGNDIILKPDPKDAKANDALAKVEKLNPGKSDFNVVKDMIDKSNCVIYQSGMTSPNSKPTYELISMDFLRKRAPEVTFVLWDQINPNKSIYPILGMKTSINNYLAGQTLGVNASAIDSSSKQKKTKKAGADSAKDFTDNLSSHDGSMSGSGNDAKGKTVPVPDAGEGHSLTGVLTSAIHQAMESALQYEISTVGIADLLPGRRVNVKVADVKFLSGAYDLYEVTHEMGEGGFDTSITLAMTGGLAVLLDKGVEKTQQGLLAAAGVKSSTTDGVPQK